MTVSRGRAGTPPLDSPLRRVVCGAHHVYMLKFSGCSCLSSGRRGVSPARGPDSCWAASRDALGRRQERVGSPTYQASALKRGPCSSLYASANPAVQPREPGPRRPEEGGARGYADAEADMPSAEASGAICVQRFDDSRNSAIHTTYRISLRSSSIREPRYPLLRVVIGLWSEPERAGRHDCFRVVCGLV